MKQTLLWIGCVIVLAGGVATAQDRLADERWSEIGYGLSLLPPKHARLIDDPPGDSLVSFIDDDGTTITLKIIESEQVRTINELKGGALRALSFPHPSWLSMEDPHPLSEVAGRPAGRVYAALPDEKQGDWVAGYAFIKIDDFATAQLDLRTSAAGFKDAQQTFEAVIDSIRIMDPDELFASRTRQMIAADTWRDTVSDAQLAQATPPRQWLRIVVKGRDIGYMRISRGSAEVFGQPGTRMTVQSHSQTERLAADHEDEFFESDDGRTEIWSHKVTRRVTAKADSLPGNSPPESAASVAETGLRNGRRLDVTIETPTRVDPKNWMLPDDEDFPYLSQVDKLLIGPLLPRQSEPMAFYSYNPVTRGLSLMTVRTEPINQGPHRGGKCVYLRPAPTQREEQMIYDADGRLVEWRQREGRVLEAATEQELRQVWDLKE